jgi:hypothetical protein
MMIRQKSLIGMELDCTYRTIEASQISQIHRVFYQSNSFSPLKTLDTNKYEPYHHIPPFLLGNLVSLPVVYRALGLNINNVLLSRESIISHRVLSVGNSITIRTFLKNAYEQQASSSPIGFIILESIGCLEKDLVFYCERVIAVRGGFQRGRPG